MNLKTNGESIGEWKAQMVAKSPTFRFWQLILELELLGMIFVHTQRQDNLDLYVQYLKEMVRIRSPKLLKMACSAHQ